MLKRNRKNNTSVVGLDLDPSHIAAAEVSVNGHIAIKRGAVAELRPGILRDGEVTDAPALTEALKTLLRRERPAQERPPGRGEPAHRRALARPAAARGSQALDAAVRAEAPDHIPMPMDEAILDYVPLGHRSQTVGGPRMRVVIVAVRRELIDRLVSAAKGAGLKVEGIDLAAFGMVRALASKEEDERRRPLHQRRRPHQRRRRQRHRLPVHPRRRGRARARSSRRSPSAARSRSSTRGCGSATSASRRRWRRVEGDAELVAATRATLEEGVHQLADTVRNSLNFYRMQDNAETVSRALLTGPAVTIPGFADKLAELLNLPVEIAVVADRRGARPTKSIPGA